MSCFIILTEIFFFRETSIYEQRISPQSLFSVILVNGKLSHEVIKLNPKYTISHISFMGYCEEGNKLSDDHFYTLESVKWQKTFFLPLLFLPPSPSPQVFLSLEKEKTNFTESYSNQEEQFIVHISNLLWKACAFSITHTIPHQHSLLND